MNYLGRVTVKLNFDRAISLDIYAIFTEPLHSMHWCHSNSQIYDLRGSYASWFVKHFHFSCYVITKYGVCLLSWTCNHDSIRTWSLE